MDVYVATTGKVRLMDFNPIRGFTAPLLFDWDELGYGECMVACCEYCSVFCDSHPATILDCDRLPTIPSSAVCIACKAWIQVASEPRYLSGN